MHVPLYIGELMIMRRFRAYLYIWRSRSTRGEAMNYKVMGTVSLPTIRARAEPYKMGPKTRRLVELLMVQIIDES